MKRLQKKTITPQYFRLNTNHYEHGICYKKKK